MRRLLLSLALLVPAAAIAAAAGDGPMPTPFPLPGGPQVQVNTAPPEQPLVEYPTGAVPPKAAVGAKKTRPALKAAAPPVTAGEAEYDCRSIGLVPPVKNQKSCGSCWDFAGVGIVESAHIKAGKGTAATVSFSEQYVLDCNRNGGCNGDWPETALEVAKTAGLPAAKDYPYRASVGPCRQVAHPFKVDEYGYVGAEDAVAPTQAIKDAIKAHGPVCVAVAADGAFMNYRSGIFKGTGSRGINHAVILVGWKDDAAISTGGYWILRNTWDTTWGEQGYMRIAYQANSVGFGAMWCKVNGQPPVPPDPPVPPTPGGTVTVTVGGESVVIDPSNKSVKLPPGWRTAAGIEEDLAAAGIDPRVIADVLKLVADVREKKDFAVVLADVFQLLTDLQAKPATPGCCQPPPAARPVPDSPEPALAW